MSINQSHVHFSQQKSSIANFRLMLDRMRMKNSGTLPQNARPYFTQRYNNKDIERQSFSSLTSQAKTDDPIKLKPKATMNGRDLYQKDMIPITHSIDSNQMFPAIHNKSNRKVTDKKHQLNQLNANNPKQKYLSSKYSIDRSSVGMQSNDNQAFLEDVKGEIRKQQMGQSIESQKKQIKIQKRFNLRVVNSFPICKMPINQVIQYFITNQPMNNSSTPAQIFQFFNKLLERVNIFIGTPMVKKYKNCIFFGEAQEGILYYFIDKVYYGGFRNGQKNGEGVDIQLSRQKITETDCAKYGFNKVYSGTFFQGKKIGNFIVDKPEEHYEGFMEDGIYQGHGKLSTKQSIYEGQFWKGFKHGIGKQEVFCPDGTKTMHIGCFYKGNYVGNTKKRIKEKQPFNGSLLDQHTMNITYHESKIPQILTEGKIFNEEDTQFVGFKCKNEKKVSDNNNEKNTTKNIDDQAKNNRNNRFTSQILYVEKPFDLSSQRQTEPIQYFDPESSRFLSKVSEQQGDLSGELAQNRYRRILPQQSRLRKQTSNTTQEEDPLPLPHSYSKNIK